MKKSKPVLEKVRFDVLKTDIMKGKRDDPHSCAVARAIKRRGFESVEVTTNVEFSTEGKHYAGKLPANIINWIAKFDKAKTKKARVSLAKPFSFDVEVRVR